MRLPYIPLSSLTVWAVSAVLWAACAHGDVPVVACDVPIFEFGRLPNAMDVKHTFKIRNDGKAPLEIAKVRTTCGCTTATLATHSLAPGEETGVEVTLSLHGRSGLQRKYIYVETNDPETPKLVLQFHGETFAEVEATPTAVFFGRVSRDSVDCKRVKIVSHVDQPVHVTGVEVKSPYITHALETVRDGREYILSLSLTAPRPYGDHAVIAKIKTDYPKMPVVNISVSVYTEQDVTVIPKIINVRSTEVPKPSRSKRYVIVRSTRQQDFEVTSVESPAESITVKTTKLRNGCFRLEIDGVKPDPAFDGKALKVRTNVADCELLEVPIRVIQIPKAEK